MPTYTYNCSNDRCGRTEEQIRKIADRDRVTVCKGCRRPMDRGIDAPGGVYAPTSSGSSTIRV